MNDTTPLETTPTPDEAPRRRGVLRPVLIGVGSGVAILALGIGGFSVADELRDDDRVVVTSGSTTIPLGDDSASPRPSSSDDSSSPSPSASDDHGGRNVSADDYARVSAAALAAVGGGTVTELKRDDDPGIAWEVEIRLANGDEAEVELAADLSVVRIDLDRNDDSDNSGSGSDDSGRDDSDDRSGDDDRSGHGGDDD
jgi:hypothetical protein